MAETTNTVTSVWLVSRTNDNTSPTIRHRGNKNNSKNNTKNTVPSQHSTIVNKNNNKMSQKRQRNRQKRHTEQQQNTNLNNQNNDDNNNNHQQLQWLVNNIEKHYLPQQQVSHEVFQALQQLTQCQTQQEIEHLGQVLAYECYDVSETCTTAVHERLVKAASMMGLSDLALLWMQTLFLQHNKLPCYMAQDSLCSNLRNACRYQELESLLQQMGRVAIASTTASQNHNDDHNDDDIDDDDNDVGKSFAVSLSCFNLYLASLSDHAISIANHANRRQPNNNNQDTDVTTTTSTTSAILLQQAWEWVTTNKAQNELGIEPDDVSFATVLEAAAKVGNRTLSDQLWQFMENQQQKQHDKNNNSDNNEDHRNKNNNSNKQTEDVTGSGRLVALPLSRPSIRNVNAYNARLKLLTTAIKTPHTTASSVFAQGDGDQRPLWNFHQQEQEQQQDNDSLAMSLWEEMILDPHVQPDAYTIDMMLLPWVRQQQQEQKQEDTLSLSSSSETRNVTATTTTTNNNNKRRRIVLESVLDDFCYQNAPKVVSDAFAAFLVRLCQPKANEGGNNLAALLTARAMLEMYILLVGGKQSLQQSSLIILSNNDNNNGIDELSTPPAPQQQHKQPRRRRLRQRVIPQTRHFNIVLDGYRNALRRKLNNKSHVVDRTTLLQLSPPPPPRNKEGLTQESTTTATGATTATTGPLVMEKRVHLRDEGWKLFRILMSNSSGVKPDAVTITTMMGLCTSSLELCRLLKKCCGGVGRDSSFRPGKSRRHGPNKALSSSSSWLNKPIVLRAAMTRFGELGDVSSALWLFLKFGLSQPKQQLRLWNVLLGAISKATAMTHNKNNNNINNNKKMTRIEIVNVSNALISSHLMDNGQDDSDSLIANHWIAKELRGLPFPQASEKLLSLMMNQSAIHVVGNKKATNDTTGIVATTRTPPHPDSQSFCLTASALQHGRGDPPAETVVQLFRQAMKQGIKADGRFLNALLRCFGEDINAALDTWK